MKTLRDEWRRMTDAMWQHLFTNPFFRKYGDYRVVEGELSVRKRLDRRSLVVLQNSSGYVDIGACGDTKTLILPPEEKEVRTAEEARRQLLRADRFEKALREIAGATWPMVTVREGVKLLRKIAREALDENAWE